MTTIDCDMGSGFGIWRLGETIGRILVMKTFAPVVGEAAGTPVAFRDGGEDTLVDRRPLCGLEG
jgi:hypothetical protein